MNQELSVLGQYILKLAQKYLADNNELLTVSRKKQKQQRIDYIVTRCIASAVHDLGHPTIFYNNTTEKERIFEYFTQYVKGEVNQEKKT